METFLGKQRRILFYRADREYGFLANPYKCEVEFEGRIFKSAEHAYQFGKFAHSEDAEIAMQLKPHLVAILGHGLFKWDVSPEWNKRKLERMEKVLRAKFTQNEDLGHELMKTGGKILIENSKTDAFWGLGKHGTGKNMLGIYLMQLRTELKRGDWHHVE